MRKQPIFEEHFDSLINCYASSDREKKITEFFGKTVEGIWFSRLTPFFGRRSYEYYYENEGICEKYALYREAFDDCMIEFTAFYPLRDKSAFTGPRGFYYFFTNCNIPDMKKYNPNAAMVLSQFTEIFKVFVEDSSDTNADAVIKKFDDVKKALNSCVEDLNKLKIEAEEEMKQFEASVAAKKEVKEEAKEAAKVVEAVEFPVELKTFEMPATKEFKHVQDTTKEVLKEIAKEGEPKRKSVKDLEGVLRNSLSNPNSRTSQSARKSLVQLQDSLKLIENGTNPDSVIQFIDIAPTVINTLGDVAEEEMKLEQHEHEKAQKFQNALANAYNQYLKDKNFKNLCKELVGAINDRDKHSFFSKSASYLKDIVKNSEKCEKLKKSGKLGIKHLDDLKKSIDKAIKAGKNMENRAKREKKGHPPILSYKIVQDALSKIYEVVDKERDNSNL